MIERLIKFNSEMFQALEDGRKTQTRRVVKPQPVLNHPDSIFRDGYTFMSSDGNSVKADWTSREPRPQGILRFCPYGAPGDILHAHEATSMSEAIKKDLKGDTEPLNVIILEVTAVRVERLHEITARGAWDEGLRCGCMSPVPECAGNLEKFHMLWDELYKFKGLGWNLNPWVFVIDFKMLQS